MERMDELGSGRVEPAADPLDPEVARFAEYP